MLATASKSAAWLKRMALGYGQAWRTAHLISSQVFVSQSRSWPSGSTSPAAAHVDAPRVVTGVVEILRTGRATRDAARHRGAPSMAHAGLDRRGELG